mmetsp:Transcript_80633/g.216058  ORF Transcript_80633/g.216058 Transcript_80633/m.216058 type:complete len:231 (+) Transcript_80633:1910-2602(+)
MAQERDEAREGARSDDPRVGTPPLSRGGRKDGRVQYRNIIGISSQRFVSGMFCVRNMLFFSKCVYFAVILKGQAEPLVPGRARWPLRLQVAVISSVFTCCVALASVHYLVSSPAATERLEIMIPRSQWLWNLDSELDGDCRCERPYDLRTRVVHTEIVCHCPRSFLPAEPRFLPTDPPMMTKITHNDGCKCVLKPDKLGRMSELAGDVVCTCPVLPPLNADEDFDTHPYK